VAVEADPQRNEGAAPRPAPASLLPARFESALGPGLRGTATAATVVLLLAGGVLRVVLAIVHQGVIYPDETYQMTEAAHRLVFGYGIVPWEFQQGLRSWIGPGFLVPPTALAGVLGLDGLHLMILVKVWVALWTTGGAVAGALGARRLAGPLAGLLAASLTAFSPLSAVYEVHPLADSVAAPLPVLALALLSRPPSRPRADGAALAGVLLVVSVSLRPQLVIVVLGFVVATLLTRNRARILGLGAGLGGGAVLSGLLDALTWGTPFAPLWRSVTFNIVDDGASTWGRSPARFYVAHAVAVSGTVIAVLLAAGLLLALLSGRTATLPSSPIATGVLAFLSLLSAIPHKELRFLVPALPLTFALAAVGLTRIVTLVPGRYTSVAPVTAMGLAVLAVAAGSLRLPHLTMRDLGYRNDSRSAWVIDDVTPRLLSRAGTLPATCGVALASGGLTWSGGYSYLHRNVPLAYVRGRGVGDWRAWANVVITRPGRLPVGYQVVLRIGRGVLAERSGPCAPAPPAVRSRIMPGPT
jgi:GPI mannosyltransferase 3